VALAERLADTLSTSDRARADRTWLAPGSTMERVCSDDPHVEPTSTAAAFGPRFAQALATNDSEALRAVLHTRCRLPRPDTQPFLGGSRSRPVLDIVFGDWFGPRDELDEVVLLDSDTFAGREQLRFGRNRDGPMIVEQQAYIAERDA
jgi:hypothetical protein